MDAPRRCALCGAPLPPDAAERLAAILDDFGVHDDRLRMDRLYNAAFREFGLEVETGMDRVLAIR